MNIFLVKQSVAKVFLFLALGITAVLALSSTAGAAPGFTNDPSVSICHATESATNPYTSQTVNGSAIITGPNGHDNHDTGGLDDKGDIIPPFDYDPGTGTTTYPGKNWTTDYGGYSGEEVYNNGSCDGGPLAPVPGCTDPAATNYNPDATEDDGSCTYPPVLGCTDPAATNYNPDATEDDGSCTYPPPPVPGCTDPDATNYNPDATEDDGSCVYPPPAPQCAPSSQSNPPVSATSVGSTVLVQNKNLACILNVAVSTADTGGNESRGGRGGRGGNGGSNGGNGGSGGSGGNGGTITSAPADAWSAISNIVNRNITRIVHR